MARKIKIEDLRKAVDNAYEQFKSVKEGAVDPRVAGKVPEDTFGISVVLADGTVISKGDTKVKGALGDIASLTIHAELLQQNSVEGLVKKAGKTCPCAVRKLDLPISAHGVRAYSAVQPTGDADGKYDVLINNLINMMGSAPELDDSLYKTLVDEAGKADVENQLANVGYTLYDDAQSSIKGYAKMEALTVDTDQLATIGATIAADGVCPANKQVAFDGAISAPLTAIAAATGKTHHIRKWLMEAGAPAVFSFSGLALAILPGVGAIAAYSPEVCTHGRTKKGRQAITYITNALQYNVFASARVEIVK